MVQQDRHDKLLFIRQMAVKESTDLGRQTMHRTGLTLGLRLIKLDQLDRPVGGPCKAVQHIIQCHMIGLKRLQALIESLIGSGQLREELMILPSVVSVQVPHKVIAIIRQTSSILLGIPGVIEV